MGPESAPILLSITFKIGSNIFWSIVFRKHFLSMYNFMTSTKYKRDIPKRGYKDEWQRSRSKGSYILVEEIRHVTRGTKLEVASSEEEVVWELTHSTDIYWVPTEQWTRQIWFLLMTHVTFARSTRKGGVRFSLALSILSLGFGHEEFWGSGGHLR